MISAQSPRYRQLSLYSAPSFQKKPSSSPLRFGDAAGLAASIPAQYPQITPAPGASTPNDILQLKPASNGGIQPTAPASTNASASLNPVLKSLAGKQILYPIEPVKKYIYAQWDNLLVTPAKLLDVIKDPKVHQPPGMPWRLYISDQENPQRVWGELQKALPPDSLRQIQLATLPPPGPARNNLPPGLLYLPHSYVVPGGRFKEMYGWDSFFIQLGLLKDGHLQRAKDMIDNHLYEINHYGTIFNANRSYFMDRSQPPFVTEMVLNVYNKTGDKAWLQQTLPAIEKHYAYWNSGGHLITQGPAAGLSRYYSYGEGPALEVQEGEVENGKSHYEKIADFYRTHKVTDYDVKDYYDSKTGKLTPLFYKADRTMRESGFDPSNRFGQFNIDVLNYAPVCLNSLLFKMEKDMSHIYNVLDKPEQAEAMTKLAELRKQRMNNVLWDDKTGTYLDYNIKTNQRRFYPYATMFMPLWVGAASPEQAKKVSQKLPFLEAPGGLMTSAVHSGNQWDAPFMWAPLQYFAVGGLQNYGENDAAARLATKYVNTVAKGFSEHKGIFEKYDVNRMASDVADGIDFGYDSNELGFGWTNGVFLEMLDVAKNTGMPKPATAMAAAVSTMPNNPFSMQQNLFRKKNSNPFLK